MSILIIEGIIISIVRTHPICSISVFTCQTQMPKENFLKINVVELDKELAKAKRRLIVD